jgi:hypothetical protein
MARDTWSAAALLFLALALGGCASVGPPALQEQRLLYNEAVKRTTEEQLLLNIVRLRYNDSPSSLAVSAIAAQWERVQSASIVPFFAASGADVNTSYRAILPQAQVGSADRPTVSLTPLDDSEFTRKLFTPMTLDGVLYLAKTTWPIATVFRLYLENLNWVPNAQTASGPTPRTAPEVDDFLRGVRALQSLQDSGRVVFSQEERIEAVGSPLPAASVTARDQIEAAKGNLEYRQDEKTGMWSLVRKVTVPVILMDPDLGFSPDYQVFARAFRLKPGLARFDITQEANNPFARPAPGEGNANLDLETRSLLQALYYVSHGIDVPVSHAERGVLTVTQDAAGAPFDWSRVMAGFFRVRSTADAARPPDASVAVRYRDHWFYIDDRDQDTKATFSLLVEVSRLELAGKAGPGPVLTLPVGGK